MGLVVLICCQCSATNKLNSRPGKCLDYKTPYEAFKESTGIDARESHGLCIDNLNSGSPARPTSALWPHPQQTGSRTALQILEDLDNPLNPAASLNNCGRLSGFLLRHQPHQIHDARFSDHPDA